jgi:hypothetical protein
MAAKTGSADKAMAEPTTAETPHTATMESSAEPSMETPTEAATVSSTPEGHCVSGKIDNGTKGDSGNKRDNDLA